MIYLIQNLKDKSLTGYRFVSSWVSRIPYLITQPYGVKKGSIVHHEFHFLIECFSLSIPDDIGYPCDHPFGNLIAIT